MTPPMMLWVFTASGGLDDGAGGTDRGATASDRPDILREKGEREGEVESGNCAGNVFDRIRERLTGSRRMLCTGEH